MYSKEEQKEISNLTDSLLKQKESFFKKENPVEELSLLKRVVLFHDWRYYILSEPLISDFEYDSLFKLLQKIESENPDLITDDSPTQRVGGGITDDFPPVAHLLPMLSLDNSYSSEDLNNWKTRLERFVKEQDITFTAEPKYDGSSIALVYENDKLIRVATRGDGQSGEEITMNAKVLKSLPLKAAFSRYGIHKAELRGEVLISKEKFEQLNNQRLEEGLTLLANPRNAASGALRLKDSSEVSKRSLEAFIYQLAFAEDSSGNNLLLEKIPDHKSSLDILYSLGFKIPKKEFGHFQSINEVVNFCAGWEEKRDAYPFEIDGIVVKVNEYKYQQLAGSTSHHPRWAIAYKFKARQATTRLERIEFQVGRTGAVTPVAKVSPVSLAGVTVTSISMFNEDFIKDKDIRIGDKVLIERAGDVIPYVVKSLEDVRDGSEKVIEFPDSCPSCHSKLTRPEGEAVSRCINALCPAQLVEKLIHFVSKDAMDIRGLGESLIKRFYEMDVLKTIPDIYTIDFDKVRTLEGFGEKSVENLEKAILKSKKAPLYRLIFGLGIRFVGLRTAKNLAAEIEDLNELTVLTEEQLLEIEDIGPKVAGSILDFFSVDENKAMIQRLEDLGLNIVSDKSSLKQENLPFSGKTFLFTGSLETFSRKEAADLVESLGGKTISAVSKNLNYLVVGASPGSKLTKAEKIEEISILSEEEFKNMIETINK